MNKTDYRHYNVREKRLLALETDYFCAYIRQETKHGKVTDVKYSGNTVYGSVYLQIDNKWYVMIVNKHRPAMRDLNNAILAPCAEPEI